MNSDIVETLLNETGPSNRSLEYEVSRNTIFESGVYINFAETTETTFEHDNAQNPERLMPETESSNLSEM